MTADSVEPATEARPSRRSVLKGGAVAGSVVWAVPLVQALSVRAADAASGGGTVPPPPASVCLARALGVATPLLVNGQPVPDTAVVRDEQIGVGDDGGSAGTVVAVTAGPHLSAAGLSGQAHAVVTASLAKATTTGTVAELTLTVPGITLAATTLTSTVEALAPGGPTASSSVASVLVNGIPVALSSEVNGTTTVAGGIVLTANGRSTSSSGGGVHAEAFALTIVVPTSLVSNGLTVVVGHVVATAQAC